MPTYLVTDDLPYEIDDDTRPLRFLRTVEPGELGGQSVEDYFDAQGLRVIRRVDEPT